ncbi:MAG: sigma-70 family RNA polymerase sigma factor [Chitinophagales bacterium]|nr:sigma-70 family RNA polymerase sigma factor [Chitinophagales bacterium]
MDEIKNAASLRSQEDLALVKQAVEHKDEKAFEKLMARYKDSIYFMVLKMVHNRDDAEDITIESFGKAFNRLDKYDAKYAFSTWLFKIATNNCIDYIRKKRLDFVSLDEPFGNEEGDEMTLDVKSDAMNPEEKYIRHQRAVSVRGSLEKLDEKYRALIEMRYYQELSYEEIAEELNIPLGTVKAQLFRAKELLFKMLNKNKDNL